MMTFKEWFYAQCEMFTDSGYCYSELSNAEAAQDGWDAAMKHVGKELTKIANEMDYDNWHSINYQFKIKKYIERLRNLVEE